MILHSLIAASLFAAAPFTAVLGAPARAVDAAPPGIRLWTTHGEVYQRGERVRVFFRTEQDAYVTILRVDTDGRMRVLFPRQPWEDNAVRGGYTYDVPNYGRRDAFVVDDDPGIGYVFAVASSQPFTYDPFVSEDHWDLQLVADGGRIHGDPYQTLEELIQSVVPEGFTEYDTHLLPYHVERRYDYPRFVCYDCHSYVGYHIWNPYSIWCPRFTLWITNDPYYHYPSYWYPGRYYGGTRTVYIAPGQRGSRYVFKARDDQSAPGIAYRDRSRESAADRRPADRGVRGADIGGVGSVPAPGGRRAVGDASSGSVGSPTRLTPDRRIPLVRGSAQTPGRREAQPPTIRTDASPSSKPSDDGRRRAVANPGGNAPQPVQPPADRPRGVVIDPTAGVRRQPSDRADDGKSQAAPAESQGRRAEPVYIGRQPTPSRTQDRPSSSGTSRAPERRAEPRAAPQPERRSEPRAQSPSRGSSSRPSSQSSSSGRRRSG